MRDIKTDPTPKPKRPFRKRLWWKILLGLGVAVVVLVAALPSLLGTAPARRWLLQRANQALGPGDLSIATLRFSWTQPTRMTGFVIRDEQGETLVEAPSAVWDRSLFQAIFRRPRLGKLRLESAKVDVERRPDGTIDLVEFLSPVLKGEPQTDLTIEVANGSLRLRSPELAEPVVASDFRVQFHRAAAPSPTTWVANLGMSGDQSLRLTGQFDRWDGKPAGQNALNIGMVANLWPIAIQRDGLRVNAEVSRTLKANRTNGFWSLDSGLEFDSVAVSGAMLSGDQPRIDHVAAGFSVEQGPSGWVLRGLDVRSPVGSIRSTGEIPAEPGRTNRVEGQIDLAAVASLLPQTLGLREGLTIDRGVADLSVVAGSNDQETEWTVEASLADLAGHLGETVVTLREPASLTIRARDRGDSLTVETLSLQSAFLKAEGHGDLQTGIVVDGTIDLEAFTRQAADFVDLSRAGLAGSGTISGKIRRSSGETPYTGSLSLAFEKAYAGPADDPIALEGLHLAVAQEENGTTDATLGVASARRVGLDLGPTEIHALYHDGAVELDPIATSLNGGILRLVPVLDLASRPAVFRLLPGTELADAEVNERATQRVLAFVAPILEGATRASGKVSAKIDRAEFPIGANSLDEVVVEGNVVFKDVTFSPGPVARDLLAMVNRSDSTLTIDQPVVLSISDGKIHQTGFSVPIGDVTELAIEGTVGFDKTLDLMASMPITDAMFPNRGIVGDLISGTRVRVPIGGTLDKPKIDRDAFREAMKDLGKDMAIRSATQGAARLLFRLAQPRDPNSPKPLTAAERKAKRLEKKLERKSRGSEPN